MMKRVFVLLVMFFFISATNSRETAIPKQGVQASVNPANELDRSISKLDSSLNELDHKITGL